MTMPDMFDDAGQDLARFVTSSWAMLAASREALARAHTALLHRPPAENSMGWPRRPVPPTKEGDDV